MAPKTDTTQVTDKALPADRRAEATFVYLVLTEDAGTNIPHWKDKIPPAMLHFSDLRALYQTGIDIWAEGSYPNLLSMQTFIREREGRESQQQVESLLSNMEGYQLEEHFSCFNTHEIATEVIRLYNQRVVLQASALMQMAVNGGEDGAGAVARGLAVLENAKEVMSVAPPLTTADILDNHFVKWLSTNEGGEVPAYIPTGFKALDSIMGGLWIGQNIVMAGRPGMGKSSVAIAMLDELLKAGRGVYLMSAEMSAGQVINRIMARRLGVDAGLLRDGKFPHLAQAYHDGLQALKGRFTLDDGVAGKTPADIAERLNAERLNGRNLDVAIVDHLGIIDPVERTSNPYERASQVMGDLTSLAKRSGVAFLTLCQLSRVGESQKDKRPTLGFLRDSGRIEEDAFGVVGLYRGGYYGEAEAGDAMELIVLKNREGGVGTAKVVWVPSQMTIKNGVFTAVQL